MIEKLTHVWIYKAFYNHQTANVLGSIALHDSISGTTRYQKLVTENLGKLHSEAVNPYVSSTPYMSSISHVKLIV